MFSEYNNGELYENIYEKLKKYLINQNPKSTNNITKTIKKFFQESCLFENKNILTSDSGGEFLLDISVTTFKPLEIIREKNKKFKIIPGKVESIIGVESELGGTGGTSAYGVMENVVEDFCKLLLVNSKFKIMIFTSLKYISEDDENHIINRVKTLKEIYVKSKCKCKNGILLIHLKGTQPSSDQVQATVGEKNISGFIIKENGDEFEKIKSN